MWDKRCVEPLLQSGDEMLQKNGDVIKRAQIKCQMNEKNIDVSVQLHSFKVRKCTLNNQEKHISHWEKI